VTTHRALIAEIEKIGGGVRSVEQLASANSRVLRIRTVTADYLAKLYPRIADDRRDRLRTEFSAVEFMWKHGLRQIPEPILSRPESAFAVYRFVEGVGIVDVSPDDIDQATTFVEALASLRTSAGSDALGPASEACFSLEEIEDQLVERRKRFETVRPYTRHHQDALAFVEGDLEQTINEAIEEARCVYDDAGLDSTCLIGPEHRALSPSDFGFHNALRRSDGQLAFVDFEYFGWDDPAKLVCDFVLHPAMTLTSELKAQFASRVLSIFSDDSTLRHRIQALRPLWALKWCLIVLNEFLPGSWERRRLAHSGEMEGVLKRQVEKARDLLSAARQAMEFGPLVGSAGQ